MSLDHLQECKEHFEGIMCSIIAHVFYSPPHGGPPLEHTRKMMDVLLPEATLPIKEMFRIAKKAVDEEKDVADVCPPEIAPQIANLAERFYMPTWTWDTIITKAREAYVNLQKARQQDDRGDNRDNGDSRRQLETVGVSSGSVEDNLGHFTPKATKATPWTYGALRDEITEFVKESEGLITTEQIDREFGLRERSEKKARSKILQALLNKNIIRRDKRVRNKFYILKEEIEEIDLDEVEDENFPVVLPFDLNQKVNIPNKCIIVIAGGYNSGKTAVALNLAKENLGQDFPIYYCMSEMGPSEYKERVKKIMDGDITPWKRGVTSVEATGGFDGIISKYNPDGLTIIDYLEEIEGEYYKITSDIRSMYDSLNKGVVVVCLQKHSEARVGRGGEGTVEKARLYLTIDSLVNRPRLALSAIKIEKAKSYKDFNPNGLERHVKISGGKDMTPISDWMYCNQAQRKAWIKKYEHQQDKGWDNPGEGNDEIVARIQIDDGGAPGNILQKDLDKWQESMPNIDVKNLLNWIEEKAKKGDMKFTRKSWYTRIASILGKRNEKEGGQ